MRILTMKSKKAIEDYIEAYAISEVDLQLLNRSQAMSSSTLKVTLVKLRRLPSTTYSLYPVPLTNLYFCGLHV